MEMVAGVTSSGIKLPGLLEGTAFLSCDTAKISSKKFVNDHVGLEFSTLM